MSADVQAASEYAPHPSIAYAQSIVAGMKAKSGRSLEEWVDLVARDGPPTDSERRDWLQRLHGLGMNYRWYIVERAAGRGEDDTDPDAYLRKAPEYVDAMYSGKRAALRILHDRVVALARAISPDVKVCPCTTMVPFYRNYQFAQVKPATNSRIDVGFALRNTPVQGRLIDTGGFAKKDRITHRIPISSLEQIDGEVDHWLRTAYEMDG